MFIRTLLRLIEQKETLLVTQGLSNIFFTNLMAKRKPPGTYTMPSRNHKYHISEAIILVFRTYLCGFNLRNCVSNILATVSVV